MTNPQDQRSTREDDGPASRPAGTVDEDANPPLQVPPDDTPSKAADNLPPQDNPPAVPPYEGRQTSADDIGESAHGGANAGGASRPVEDANYKAPSPDSTPGGATASPADEQPASEAPETDLDDDQSGPGHVAGTRRGEDKP